MELKILYEDNDIIVCVKPPKVPAQSDKTMDYDMVSRVRNYLSEQGKDTYVAIVHRLDRPVGGVMVFALNKNAAALLSEDIRLRNMKKYYVAAVCPKREIKNEEQAEWILLEDYLVKNAKDNTSKIVNKGVAGAKLCQLRYQIVDKNLENGLALVKVELLTGRHHQIRVQMAGCGLPLYGDTKYNSIPKTLGGRKIWQEIALFAYCLEFKHPRTKKELEFISFPDNFPVPYNEVDNYL